MMLTRRRLLIVLPLVVASCSSAKVAAPSATSTTAGTVVTSASAPATSASLAASTVPVAISTTVAAAATPVRCQHPTAGHEIKLWHSLGGNTAIDELDLLVKDFNLTHETKLVTRKVGGYDDMLRELTTVPVDQWPDIIAAPEAATRSLLDSAHFLAPADCFGAKAKLDDLLPVVAATYTIDGKLAAVPYGVSTPVLFFDKAEFKKAGLDPVAPPRTTAELVAASATIKASGASPFGLVISDHFGEWVAKQGAAKRAELIGEPNNGRDGNGLVGLHLDTLANVAELTLFREAIAAGHAKWIGGLKSDFDDLLAIVAEHDGGTMTIHTSGSVGDVLSLLAAGNFPGVELGISPMPGPGAGALVGGNALWLVDHADPDRAGATAEVIDWLTAPKQLAAMSMATGYVPATRSAAAEPELLARWQDHPELRVAYDQLASMPATTATAGVLIGPSVELDYALYNASVRVATTKDPIDQILADTDASMDKLIDNYRSTHR